MVRRKLPTDEAELQRIAFEFSLLTGAARQEFATRLGFTHARSLYLCLKEHGCNVTNLKAPIPLSDKERYDKPPRFTGSWLVTADWHTPYHDAHFANRVIELAQSWKIENHLVVGDFWDLAAFSVFVNKPSETFPAERRQGIAVMQALGQLFRRNVLIAGNHDTRLVRLLKEQVGMEEMLALYEPPDNFEITNYHYCYVGKWLLAHPRNASVIAARVPTILNRKFSEYNVAGAHGHNLGLVGAEDGKHLAVDIGIMADPRRIDYLSEHMTTRPWVWQGALILMERDGHQYPYLLTADHTDFAALERLY